MAGPGRPPLGQGESSPGKAQVRRGTASARPRRRDEDRHATDGFPNTFSDRARGEPDLTSPGLAPCGGNLRNHPAHALAARDPSTSMEAWVSAGGLASPRQRPSLASPAQPSPGPGLESRRSPAVHWPCSPPINRRRQPDPSLRPTGLDWTAGSRPSRWRPAGGWMKLTAAGSSRWMEHAVAWRGAGPRGAHGRQNKVKRVCSKSWRKNAGAAPRGPEQSFLRREFRVARPRPSCAAQQCPSAFGLAGFVGLGALSFDLLARFGGASANRAAGRPHGTHGRGSSSSSGRQPPTPTGRQQKLSTS